MAEDSKQSETCEAGEAIGRGAEVRAATVATVGLNIRVFFRGQFGYLQQKGFRFTVITSDPTAEGLCLPSGTKYCPVRLTRAVTPLADLLAVWRLFRLFRRGRFDLVQYTTPKGALLGSLAAFLARIPVRLYLMWGIYYVAQRGLKRRLFKLLDGLACRLSTHVTFDGFDIRRFAIEEGLCTEGNSSVVADGSENGIDLDAYDPEKHREAAAELRRHLGIPSQALVIGTVMRLVGDKGINELVAAFEQVAADRKDVYLLLVGPEEVRDRPRPETQETMSRDLRIVLPGLQADVLPYYAAMDIFCLPTYREGFSTVNLEASAMGLPVVTTDAIGAAETVVDGRTGLIVPVRTVDDLAAALRRLAESSDLRRRMGQAGRRRVREKFEQQAFWECLFRHRAALLIAGERFERCDGRLVRKGGKD